MYKLKIIYTSFLVLCCFNAYALKIDSMLIFPDERGNGSLRLTNDEKEMLFIDSKIEEIIVNSKNQVVRKEYTANNRDDWKVAISTPKLILKPGESKPIRINNLCSRKQCDTSKDQTFLISFFPVSDVPVKKNYGFAPVFIIPTPTPKFNVDVKYKGNQLTIQNRSNTMVNISANTCHNEPNTFKCIERYSIIANRTKTFDLSKATKKSIDVRVTSHDYTYNKTFTASK